MTFEYWEKERPRMLGGRLSILNDWKAEREHDAKKLAKYMVDKALEREELIGVLERLLVFTDGHFAAGTEWYEPQKLAIKQARAVLAEVKESGR